MQNNSKIKNINELEGLFIKRGTIKTDSSHRIYVCEYDITRSAKGRVNSLIETAVPSALTEEGTLLVIVNDSQEGLGKFPRKFSAEEKGKILGKEIEYTEREFWVLEDCGQSYKSGRNEYKIKTFGDDQEYTLFEMVSTSDFAFDKFRKNKIK